MTSHFWKIFRHGGCIIVRTNGEKITGKAYSMGLEADLSDGVLSGNEFSCTMVKALPLINKPVTMRVKGVFDGTTVQGTMIAPFGNSWFEGIRISEFPD